MALDGRRDRVQVVEGADDRVCGGPGGHARAGGIPSVAIPEPASASSASTWPW